ncbi:unnamed protein product [Penicillium roqueforti FM164]|uniref:Genomic scaffold, ProqFM164S04 n=1 Tax=Penicillium roqueforti (strain FM164) TaxID=1365484 RepID=W6R1K3_PENRF|nr:unnamed protein product [Penicillium roqueforti FM164]
MDNGPCIIVRIPTSITSPLGLTTNSEVVIITYCLTPKLRPSDSAAAVRQELIELFTSWKKLGLEGSYPYSPVEAELKQHARDYEDFESV